MAPQTTPQQKKQPQLTKPTQAQAAEDAAAQSRNKERAEDKSQENAIWKAATHLHLRNGEIVPVKQIVRVLLYSLVVAVESEPPRILLLPKHTVDYATLDPSIARKKTPGGGANA